MKVSDIFEMEIKGDVGEKPPVKLSPEEKKAAWMKKNAEKVAAMKAERDASRRAKPSRLRGRGRGTAGADQSMIQR